MTQERIPSGLKIEMDDPYESRTKRFSHHPVPQPTRRQRATWLPWLVVGLFLTVSAAGWALLYSTNSRAEASESPRIAQTVPAPNLAGAGLGGTAFEFPSSKVKAEFYPVILSVTPSTATIVLDGEAVAKGNYAGRLERDGRVHVALLSADGYQEQTLTFKDLGPPSSITLAALAMDTREKHRERSTSGSRDKRSSALDRKRPVFAERAETPVRVQNRSQQATDSRPPKSQPEQVARLDEKPDEKPEPERVEVATKFVSQAALERARVGGVKTIRPSTAVAMKIGKSGKRAIGVVKMCLDSSGKVKSLKTLKSTGHATYDAKIKSKMRGWRYRPTMIGGVAMPVCSSVTFVYIAK